MGRYKYGIHWIDPCYQLDVNIELACFRDWLGTDEGGLGRLGHFKRAIKLLTPDIEWNPWTELRAREFCNIDNWIVQGNQKFLNIANLGCMSSGKTHDWTWFAVPWWLSDAMNSAVVLCSIQKNMIRQRCWAVIQEVYNALPDKAGHMVDSKTTWQAERGRDKAAIFAQAVESGETMKAVQRIAGLHMPRIMMIVDEAPGTPEAVFQVITNILGGCSEFVLVTNGNAISRLNAHGRICEPELGWPSITADTTLWRTRAVPEWSIKPGICLHYSGDQSPNVKSGKTVYPYIYTWENWKDAQGRENTLGYWVYDKGFYAPEGIANTVFEESMVVRVDGFGKFEWHSWSRPVAAFDPAFGTGDDPAFYFGTIGDLPDGRTALQIGDKVPIRIKSISDKPAEFQMAEQIMAECSRRGVKPEDFGLDATGIGRGIAAILIDKWSPYIVRVEFGGSPVEAPVNQDDPRLRREVYDRRVTELWFNCREALHAGQLRGLPKDAVDQFCKRTYDLDTKKYRLETKTDYKSKFGRSPDDADCVAVMVEVALQRGLVVKGGAEQKRGSLIFHEAKKADELYYQDEQNTEVLSWSDDFND